MTKTMRVLIAAVVAAAAASKASAQTPQTPPAPLTMGFVNINVGAQAASRTVDLSESFSLYNETATISSSQKIGSGALFDISGGYRVWRNVSAAIGFSNFSKSSDATGTDQHFAVGPRPQRARRSPSSVVALSGYE
jgi:opacity protein-like surface antigen